MLDILGDVAVGLILIAVAVSVCTDYSARIPRDLVRRWRS